jgi:cell division protein FtsB
MRLSPRFLLLSLLPAVVLVTMTAIAIWGENGLLVRHQLTQQVASAQADLADLDSANRRLLREIHTMDADPVVVERMVADELAWGREGDTLVRFRPGTAAGP